MTEMQQTDLFIFLKRGRFFWTFTLQPNASTSHYGCADWMPPLSPIWSTSVADKLTICVSWQQALCDIRDAKKVSLISWASEVSVLWLLWWSANIRKSGWTAPPTLQNTSVSFNSSVSSLSIPGVKCFHFSFSCHLFVSYSVCEGIKCSFSGRWCCKSKCLLVPPE